MLTNKNKHGQMMWLMALIVVAVTAWFMDIKILSYSVAAIFIISVMQYVEYFQQATQRIEQKTARITQPTSKIPLYLASIFAFTAGLFEWSFGVALGLAAWVYLFLRWLQRIEFSLTQVQAQLAHVTESKKSIEIQTDAQSFLLQTPNAERAETWSDQVQRWIFQGNPVLKVAVLVLVIGVVLLLRFATEHWQLSLVVKLGLIALISLVVTGLGFYLFQKNRSFAIALEGIGLATLCLTLFFAYYNLVIASLSIASLCFVVIMALTLWLSLKQESLELALMALVIAYIAPFTLPIRFATITELITYYLVINFIVAILSSLRPWKFLNQLTFLMTVLLGTGYAFFHLDQIQKPQLSILILAHSAIYIWLGFRYSQLRAQQDFDQFKLKPILDISLIFGAPIIAYTCLYVLYFDFTLQQAGFSLLFAVVFAVLYYLSKTKDRHVFIAQSYLSLMFIFFALIPPILLPDQWSVVGWSIEGLAIFLYALMSTSQVSRYVAFALLLMAGCTGLYYFDRDYSTAIYWILALCYSLVVVIANIKAEYRTQLQSFDSVVLSAVQLIATGLWIFVLSQDLDLALKQGYILLILALGYTVINELLIRTNALWTWLLPKWIGLIAVYVFWAIVLLDHVNLGILHWQSNAEQIIFLISGLLMTLIWLRPLLGIREEKEWMSLGVMSSLAMTSVVLISQIPFVSMVILPLLFCGYCYYRVESPDWQIFWQTRTTLLLSILWIVCSQIFTGQAFFAYALPLLNPFDLVSLAILIAFIWMLRQQIKAGLDYSLAALMAVLSTLWVSSYVVLRALHFYLDTPLNDLELWSNATVQLSLTLLWLGLAFMIMSIASRKKWRPVWIIGGSILAIVTLKLILFDLSHIGTLTRVISFLVAGLVMLIIAYIAPIPDVKNPENEHKKSLN